jgi:hypothetical protein
MKRYALIALLLITQASFAQLKVIKLNKADIPKTVTYKGHIIDAVKYTDKTGDHIVITTSTGEIQVIDTAVKDLDLRQAKLFAYCYDISNNQIKLNWQMQDYTIPCAVDVTAKYIPGTFAVTDLNNNGNAEVWLMYRIGCRGDVSPPGMKIIMHEGSGKYAVRGEARAHLFDKHYAGGDYTIDAALKNGPEPFKKYALDLWKKNLLEPEGEPHI